MEVTKKLLELRGMGVETVNDEELALIAAAEAEEATEAAKKRPCDDYHKYTRFTLHKYSDSEFKKFFRFEKKDVTRLADCLGLENEYVHHTRITWSKLEGLCVLLRRLAYPCCLIDLQPMFARPPPVLSAIINTMLEDIYAKNHALLVSVLQPWIDHQDMVDHVFARGATMRNVWGFIDGTLCAVCQPGVGQQELYSSHKRHHGLKYQHVMCLNGMVCHTYGPYVGRKHDTTMYVDSDIEKQLLHVKGCNGDQLVLYGDGGYTKSPYLMIPFRGEKTEEQMFNIQMSSVRSSVEWGFSRLCSLWAFCNFYANQKVFLQPVGKYFLVATILTNCHTSLYGNEISSYFGMDPPSLEEYCGRH